MTLPAQGAAEAAEPGAVNSEARAEALIRTLALQAHPEGGHYREVFRSALTVQPGDSRGTRCAMTSIDFLLRRGEFSAWHRVVSDEVWHLLEGGPLRLWLLVPSFDAVHEVTLGDTASGRAPRHVVPSGWWQAAEPLGAFAYCGATVGPGFEYADFAFLRAEASASAALRSLRPDLARLL